MAPLTLPSLESLGTDHVHIESPNFLEYGYNAPIADNHTVYFAEDDEVLLEFHMNTASYDDDPDIEPEYIRSEVLPVFIRKDSEVGMEDSINFADSDQGREFWPIDIADRGASFGDECLHLMEMLHEHAPGIGLATMIRGYDTPVVIDDTDAELGFMYAESGHYTEGNRPKWKRIQANHVGMCAAFVCLGQLPPYVIALKAAPKIGETSTPPVIIEAIKRSLDIMKECSETALAAISPRT